MPSWPSNQPRIEEVLGSISSEMEGADLKARPFLPIVQFTNIRSMISNLKHIPWHAIHFKDPVNDPGSQEEVNMIRF